MKKTKTYSISELASEFDITNRTIRFYEGEGLITPERKGQQRIYNERDLVRFKLILRGKRLGFTLAEIKEMFELYDSDLGEEAQLYYVIDKIAERKISLEQQRQDIDVVLQEMKEVEKRVKKALKDLKT